MEQGVPSYALLLPNETSQLFPEEVRRCLAEYLFEIADDRYLMCSQVVGLRWSLLEVVALKNDYSDKARTMFLPLRYVLAILDLSDKEALPIGFQKKASS